MESVHVQLDKTTHNSPYWEVIGETGETVGRHLAFPNGYGRSRALLDMEPFDIVPAKMAGGRVREVLYMGVWWEID